MTKTLLVVHHTPSPSTRELLEAVLAGANDPVTARVAVPTGVAAYARWVGGAPVEREPRASLFARFGATSRLRLAGRLARSSSATPRSTPFVRTSMSLELS
jgi:hypothetical protein